MGFKDCQFKDLFRLRNRSEIVQGSLYALIEQLLGANSISLYLIWRKKSQSRTKLIVIYYI